MESQTDTKADQICQTMLSILEERSSHLRSRDSSPRLNALLNLAIAIQGVGALVFGIALIAAALDWKVGLARYVATISLLTILAVNIVLVGVLLAQLPKVLRINSFWQTQTLLVTT